MTADVTSWAKTAYTRNPQTNQPQWGFSLRSTLEAKTGSSSWSIAGNGSLTSTNRPTLTVEYRVVSGTIAFAAALGPDFQPSKFLVGRTTTLPIVVTNTSWFTWQTGGADKIGIGYRWFDADGKPLNIAGFTPFGFIDLPSASVSPNGTVAVNLAVLAPPIVTQARLRLDLVTVRNSSLLYFSDSALPALYWAPAVPTAADSGVAAYVGLSVVGKAEYPVEIAEDTNVLAVGTGLAEGGALSIDAYAGNLTYSRTDLSIPDRGSSLTVGRSYNSALLSACDGVLLACGWYTRADERMSAGLGANPVYVDPTGHRHFGLVDQVGQIGFAGTVGQAG